MSLLSGQLFLNTRSVTTHHTAGVLRVLFKDFPSEDPTVRLVLLLTVFLSEPTAVPSSLSATSETSQSLARYVESCHEEIEELGLGPLTRKDITDVLLSKFVPERFGGILEYARSVLKLDKSEMDGIMTDVALGCLEIGCKGRMLKKLVEAHEFLGDIIAAHLVKHYRISIEDLPPSEDEKACKEYSAPLCADFMMRGRVTLVGLEDAMAGPVVQMAEPVEPQNADGAEHGGEHADAPEGESDDEDGPEDTDPTGDGDDEDLVCAPRFSRYERCPGLLNRIAPCVLLGRDWAGYAVGYDPQRRDDADPEETVPRAVHKLPR